MRTPYDISYVAKIWDMLGFPSFTPIVLYSFYLVASSIYWPGGTKAKLDWKFGGISDFGYLFYIILHTFSRFPTAPFQLRKLPKLSVFLPYNSANFPVGRIISLSLSQIACPRGSNVTLVHFSPLCLFSSQTVAETFNISSLWFWTLFNLSPLYVFSSKF